MHRISFEVIDSATEIELVRLFDWFLATNHNTYYGATKPPKGSKTMVRHVRHQMLEEKRKS